MHLRFESLHKRMGIIGAKPTSSATEYLFYIIQLPRSFQLTSNSQTPLALPTGAVRALKTPYQVLLHDQGRPYLTCKRTYEFGLYWEIHLLQPVLPCVGSLTPDPTPLRTSPFHIRALTKISGSCFAESGTILKGISSTDLGYILQVGD
jgi:hypothetical protein